MKHSIKWRITNIFVIIVVCCIGSIILFNALFLEKLYVRENVSILKKCYNSISEGIIDAYNNGYTLKELFNGSKSSSDQAETNFVYILRELQDTYSVAVVLMDKDNTTYSLFQDNRRFDKRIMSYIFKNDGSNKKLEIIEKNDKYVIAVNNHSPQFENRDVTTTFVKNYSDLECFGMLSDNETAFYLTIPVGSIKEPVALYNKLLVIISSVIIIVGSMAIYFISDKITKPLLRLSEISKKMSMLEFENKYEGHRDDEIGSLGEHMNEMSSKLEKAIGDLKNANVKLKQDLKEKEQLDIMRQEFVANVSHELKTPIALIKGYAEGLEDNSITKDEESRKYYIDVIKDEAEKMSKMVYQLLDLSQLERGMSDIDIERINLSDVLDGVLKSQHINIENENVKIINEVPKDLYVWADGYKLEEIIRNYFTNAMHYVDENKIIRFSVNDIDDNKTRFSVFDSGVQLSEEDLNRVWEKFYKVDKARTRSYGGTGLGLSIVKAIAEQHNTTCGCYNDEYNGVKGVAFYFDFSTK